MSTRCQIEFREKQTYRGKERVERRTIYQHCDGYPDGDGGVVNTLKQFFEWDKSRGFDIEYSPANFIYWSKRQSVADMKRLDPEIDDQVAEDRMAHLGYGVCENDQFHGDIEFFYEVSPDQENGHRRIIAQPYEVGRPRNYDHPITRKHMKALEAVVVWEHPPGDNGR